MVYNYAKEISELTGFPIDDVLKSDPVIEYWRKVVR